MLIAANRVVPAVVRVSEWNPLDNGLLAADPLHLGRGRMHMNNLTITVPENHQIGGIVCY